MKIRNFSMIPKEINTPLILLMDNDSVNIMITLRIPMVINISSIMLHKNDIVKRIK